MSVASHSFLSVCVVVPVSCGDPSVCLSSVSQCLDLLLSQVCDIMLKHREDCVLEACVRVLCALCSDCYSFCGRMERAVSQLLDSTVEKFSTNVSEILQVLNLNPLNAVQLHHMCAPGLE